MKWLGLLAVLGACTSKHAASHDGEVSLQLELPHGVLDPSGFTSVDVVLHTLDKSEERTAAIESDGTFKLGALDPMTSVAVEATLRNNSGAAVGYGRTAIGAVVDDGT